MLAKPFDLVLHHAALRGVEGISDVGVVGGRIAAIEPCLPSGAHSEDLGGRLLIPGFVDSHVHLDKSCLLACCGTGDLKDAIRTVSVLKRDFTVEDVRERAGRTLEKAILQGTTHMRTHVEIDPRVGLRSFEAILGLKRDYAWAIDLAICVFPQEGMTNDPGTEDLLIEALEAGADLLGGCPYTDSDPAAQIARLFAIAAAFDVDLDLHLDFDLDTAGGLFGEVCRQTRAHGFGGRVAIGHATKFSAMPREALHAAALMLAEAGVAVTALPATDLYLNGRDRVADVPRGIAPVHRLAERGVTASLATNNVLNPFTPFGDCSLLRMANLYANTLQIGPTGFDACLDLVTDDAAKLMRIENYGIAVGNPADFVVLDAPDATLALAEIVAPLMGFKRGRQTFSRPLARLLRPGAEAQPPAGAMPHLFPAEP
jgi:cytosine deaminase